MSGTESESAGQQRERIAVFGVGRTGAVTAAGLARLGHDVTGIDRDEARVASLQSGDLPEAEPGLPGAIRDGLNAGRLRFSSSDRLEARFTMAFLCVDTPLGLDGAPDLGQVLGTCPGVARLVERGGLVVTRSTVPVGTAERLEAELTAAGRGDVEAVSLPEFLREGRAWEDFLAPDRIVIGSRTPSAATRVAALFQALERPLFLTDWPTAEISKYAANAFLATSVSFANEISDFCDAVGADAATVLAILRADARVGPRAYLRPGLGFGGHCLPKDTAALAGTAREAGSPLLQVEAAREVNATRVARAVGWLEGALGGLSGRRICLAGLAFKPGTDDVRQSPALRLAAMLVESGATVSGWDPLLAGGVPNVTRCKTLDDALRGADVLVIANPWPGVEGLEPAAVAALMSERVLYDAPAVLPASRWREAGFVTNRSAR